MTVKLKVDIALEGQDKTGKVFASAKASAKDLAQTVTALSTGYLAVADILGKIARFASAPIRAAIDGESSVSKLNNALRIADQYTEQNVKSMGDFASKMQMAAGMSDDLFNDMNASNVLLLRSAENAQALTVASTALAKMQGIELAQANEMLAVSLQGQDRSLKKLIPAVGQMTEEQLKAGGAIRLVTERWKEFISGDSNTTAGKLNRISEAFGELTEAMGNSFLQGLEGSGVFGALFQSLGIGGDVLEKNKNVFKELGDVVGRFVRENLGPLIENFKVLLQVFASGVWFLDKLRLSFELVAGMIVGLSLQVEALGLQFLRLWKATYRPVTDIAGMKRDWNAATGAIEENLRAREASAESLKKTTKELFGMDKQVLENIPLPGFDLPETKAFKNPKLGTDRNSAEAEITMRRTLNEQILALEMSQQNELAVQHGQAMLKIQAIDEDARRKGMGLEKQAARVKELLAQEYHRKLKDQRDQDEASILRSAGNITGALKKEYEMQLEAFRKLKFEERITQLEYLDAVKAAHIKLNKEIKTSAGSVDEQMFADNIMEYVNIAKGGSDAIITAIGAAYGPIGAAIAEVVKLFNMPAPEFNAFVASFVDEMANSIPNIIKNIAHLIEKLPELFVDGLKEMWTWQYWAGIGKALFTAVANYFKNFWAVLFGGETVSQATGALDKSMGKAVTFGSDDPNAGGGEFKIKDANLASQRKAADTFESSFSETIDQGGKTFSGYLKQAWDQTIAFLREFFDNVGVGIGNMIKQFGEWISHWGSEIWRGLSVGFENMKNWGIKIWEGLVGAVETFGSALGKLGTEIWNGLIGMIERNGNWLMGLGDKIAEGLMNLIKGKGFEFNDLGMNIFNGFWDKLVSVWGWFKTAGSNIWSGLWEGISTLWEWLKAAGKNIWTGLWEGISTLWGWLLAAGKNLYTGFWDNIRFVWDWFANLGKNLFDGFWGNVKSLWDWFGSLGEKIADGFKKSMGGGEGGLFDKIGSAIGLNQGGMVTQGMSNANLARTFVAAGALQFAGGGMVPGSGFSDTVPAVLTPGERVLSRDEVARGPQTTQVVHLNFNIAAGAKVDRDAIKQMMPEIIETLRRESRNGTLIVRQSGVY